MARERPPDAPPAIRQVDKHTYINYNLRTEALLRVPQDSSLQIVLNCFPPEGDPRAGSLTWLVQMTRDVNFGGR